MGVDRSQKTNIRSSGNQDEGYQDEGYQEIRISGKGYLDSKLSQRWVEEYEEVIRGINGYTRYIREKKGAKR